MEQPTGQTILSGIQPSGTLHIGNYLGAIKQWVEFQKGNTAYYCVVDQHAITVPYDTDKLPDFVLDVAAFYIAAGLDPEKSTIFVQSHVPAHTELAWLLGTTTPLGELSRMTQFKDKEGKQKEEASLGLFAYPVLMAADILLYQADVVPVGHDQTQHVELTRDIAKRFNNRFGEMFTIPRAFINKDTARVMSLTDPTKKMSKSDTDKSYIALLDDADTVNKKISGAVTETESVISFEHSGPAVKNLLTIYHALSGETKQNIENKFTNSGFRDFKESLAEVIINALKPLQKKFKDIRENDDELRVTLARGAQKASQVANQTLHQVKNKMGLI